jgi:hypothetical protein
MLDKVESVKPAELKRTNVTAIILLKIYIPKIVIV